MSDSYADQSFVNEPVVVTGRLTSNGEPLSGIELWFFPKAMHPWFHFKSKLYAIEGAHVFTDADGVFHVHLTRTDLPGTRHTYDVIIGDHPAQCFHIEHIEGEGPYHFKDLVSKKQAS